MQQILIAEDEPRITAFVEKGLRKFGYDTTIANNGYEALQFAQTRPFDVILLDLGLPGKDGWFVLDEIRRLKQQALVIIVTARDGESDRAESMRRGASDYITKPFRFSDLLACIQVHLSHRV
ncbi:response regulator [Oculatella sp. LEGE 06141]|uniref:response regulator transcription factor n=1 Tax=Oculatella sp. LEGE 06141 TaxID=1828648 RepID=UPI0018805AB5|nr:response regulator [Oculatella sp. LEGE 06141]MBE9179748.1 response regulator [Oculatella sp. LEGE 06141]